MPAHGAARRSRRAAEEGHASFAHAHAAISTGIRQVEPPRHNVTNQDATSQCKREACADRITGNGTEPKVARNEPTPAPGAELNTPRDASRAEVEVSAAHRVNSNGCVRMSRQQPRESKPR